MARKYDPLLQRGNVRFAPIMCVPDASDTIKRVVWTACSEYRLYPKPGTYLYVLTICDFYHTVRDEWWSADAAGQVIPPPYSKLTPNSSRTR